MIVDVATTKGKNAHASVIYDQAAMMAYVLPLAPIDEVVKTRAMTCHHSDATDPNTPPAITTPTQLPRPISS